MVHLDGTPSPETISLLKDMGCRDDINAMHHVTNMKLDNFSGFLLAINHATYFDERGLKTDTFEVFVESKFVFNKTAKSGAILNGCAFKNHECIKFGITLIKKEKEGNHFPFIVPDLNIKRINSTPGWKVLKKPIPIAIKFNRSLNMNVIYGLAGDLTPKPFVSWGDDKLIIDIPHCESLNFEVINRFFCPNTDNPGYGDF